MGRLLLANMSDDQLKAAGCKWACWGGGRRLNSTSQGTDAANSIPQEVDLDAASSHCAWACGGGRRLLVANMSDDQLKAAGCKWACWGGGRRLNSTSQGTDAANSIPHEVDLDVAASLPRKVDI